MREMQIARQRIPASALFKRRRINHMMRLGPQRTMQGGTITAFVHGFKADIADPGGRGKTERREMDLVRTPVGALTPGIVDDCVINADPFD